MKHIHILVMIKAILKNSTPTLPSSASIKEPIIGEFSFRFTSKNVYLHLTIILIL